MHSFFAATPLYTQRNAAQAPRSPLHREAVKSASQRARIRDNRVLLLNPRLQLCHQ